ncbi:hypothetical protein FRC11_005278, partial [Ceratobasidium sp. 423]
MAGSKDYAQDIETEFGDTRALPEHAAANRRQQALLALIDELAELRIGEVEKQRESSFNRMKDERISTDAEGIQKFQALDERIRSLRLKLQSFTNAVRQLGSSVGLINAVNHIRTHLTQIRYLFRENAAELFDSLPHPENIGNQRLSGHVWGKTWRHTYSSSNRTGLTEIGDLPDELKSLATGLHVFLGRLDEVPGFANSAVNTSIMAFEIDLRYHASCLEEFKGQLKLESVARYINDLTVDLGVHMSSMEDSVSTLIDVGVPITRFSQEHTTTGLQNLSTVATFLSGVTATTLQIFSSLLYSSLGTYVLIYKATTSNLAPAWQLTVTHYQTLSMACGLAKLAIVQSLVFSIASAINSQLAYHWHAAMYRSPRGYLPWWVSVWITRTPLFFLVGSVIAFSAGLCAFTYSSDQSSAVCAVVTAFTIITSSALLCVGLWFASERWIFARTKGGRWLPDVLIEFNEKVGKAIAFDRMKRRVYHSIQHTRSFFKCIELSITGTSRRLVDIARSWKRRILFPRPLTPPDGLSVAFDQFEPIQPALSGLRESQFSRFSGASQTSWVSQTTQREIYTIWRHDTRDGGTQGGRVHMGPQVMTPQSNSSSPGATIHSEKVKLSDLGKGNEEAIPEHETLSPDTRPPNIMANPPSRSTITLAPTSTGSGTGSFTKPIASQVRDFEIGPIYRFLFGIWHLQVIYQSKPARPRPLPTPPVRSIPSASIIREPLGRRGSNNGVPISAQFQVYVPTLRTMRCSQLLMEHMALVSHLQFSPDGKLLATCSWDGTALIWRVGTGSLGEFELRHKLPHPVQFGGFINQVAWSPNGSQLVTKQTNSIKLWNPETGVHVITIDRRRDVQAITWMPKGSRFLSIEWKTGSSQAGKRMYHMENILGSDLVILGTDGSHHLGHYIPRLQVWDVVVVPNEERVVAVATLLRSERDRRPVKSRHEKRILIYNLRTKEIEKYTRYLSCRTLGISLLHTEEGNDVLVSYEGKAPPQVWHIDRAPGEDKHRISLARTYFTRNPVDLVGPSYFGGTKDTFVLSASQGGEIYIWERSSGVLLHSFKAPDQELTNLAWNHKSPSGFMLADKESQGGAAGADSPMALFHTDNVGDNPGIYARLEVRRPADLSGQNEEPSQETKSLSLGTEMSPSLMIANLSGGDPKAPLSSSVGLGDVSHFEKPPSNAGPRALTDRVMHTLRPVHSETPPTLPVRSYGRHSSKRGMNIIPALPN